MIVWEEEPTLLDGEEMLFPLGLVLSKKERRITAYPSFAEEAELLASLSEDRLFTEETQAMLIARIAPRLAARGFEGEWHLTTVFSLTRREDVRREEIRPDSEALMPDMPYENLTDCRPDPLNEGYLCFGTVLDGRVVSAASENPHDPEDTVIDIGVETAEGYEGNGYAASNVAALAYYLLDPGMTVTYIAEDNNPASLRVAEKVGFTSTEKELRLVAYRL